MAIVTPIEDTALTTIATVPGRFAEFIGFQIANDGAAFNAFQVQARMGPSASWVILKSSDFTAASGFSPAWATAELATLGDGSEALLYVLGKHPYEIRLQASIASGSTEVTVIGNSGA
jgi:hypothetical protein